MGENRRNILSDCEKLFFLKFFMRINLSHKSGVDFFYILILIKLRASFDSN